MRLMRSYQLNGVLKIRWRMLKIFGVILSPFKAWCTDSREIHVHEQSIIDTIISGLDTGNNRVITVSLLCSEQELRQRLQNDVAAGLRTPDVIERSVQRISLYPKLNTIKVDTTGKSATEVAQEIASL